MSYNSIHPIPNVLIILPNFKGGLLFLKFLNDMMANDCMTMVSFKTSSRTGASPSFYDN